MIAKNRASVVRLARVAGILVALGAVGCGTGEEEDADDSASSAAAIATHTLKCSSKLVSDNLFFPDTLDANAVVTLRYSRSGDKVVFTNMSFASEKAGRYSVSLLRTSAGAEDGELLEEGFYTYYQGEDHDYLRDEIISRPIELSAPRRARITIRTRRDIPYARDSHGSCTVVVP